MISLSPLPTAHPSRFQPALVRASTDFYTCFTLAMGSSLGFGSTPRNSFALFRLAFAAAPPLTGLTLLRRVTRRIIKQKARRQAFPCGHSPPTACRRTVSDSISLPSPGCFSPFPHGTSALSVAREYLALACGQAGFPQGFTCPVVLGNGTEEAWIFSLTGLSPSVVSRSMLFS